MARRVVALRPFSLQQRLRPAVDPLLAPVGAQGVATVMPDHSGRAEAQRPPALLETPAHIHVVAGGAELGIESLDLLQRRPAKRHVAPRDVLGLPIRK